MRTAQNLGGANQLPLMGLGGFVSVLSGKLWMLFLTSSTVDNAEGQIVPTLRKVSATQIASWCDNKECMHCLVSAGEIVYIPVNWTAWLLGVVVQETSPSKGATSIWWPAPRLKAVASFSDDQLCGVNHAMAAAESLKDIKQWRTFANLKESIWPSWTPHSAPGTQI